MKIFLLWLKEYGMPLLFSAVVFLIFLSVCFLKNVPTDAVLYAAELTIFLGAVFICARYVRFRKKYRELEKMLQYLEAAEAFPEADTPVEALYQEMLRHMKREQEKQDSLARNAYQDMTEYYTMWTHQIKTPIAAMRLLLQQEDTEQTRELSTELFKVEQYVQMALQYLRLESESSDLVLKKCELDSLIRQAVKKYAPLFIRKKLTLVYEPVNCEVLTDEKWLGFVLEQVLSNAIKYTQTGSISIYLDEEQEKTLVIADTGIGIAAEDLPRVFEKGYTGMNGRYDKRSTGIGLYLSKKAMEKVSHKIEITSEIGVGTKVFLHLAACELEHQ